MAGRAREQRQPLQAACHLLSRMTRIIVIFCCFIFGVDSMLEVYFRTRPRDGHYTKE